MKWIPFTKYTCCGNNFVIVDATLSGILPEQEMARFARKATNGAFGIGCDNLLIIQRCNEATLNAIAARRRHWTVIPLATQADFVFRMFEPSGEEALCCGNGLICIADYLHHHYGIMQARVMTEIPLAIPSIRIIGRAGAGGGSWANMGYPRRIPAGLVEPDVSCCHEATFDTLGHLTIPLPSDSLGPYSNASSLTLSGYLVFTGEPHLVVFPEQGFSVPALAAAPFDPVPGRSMDLECGRDRQDLGSWLVQRIGDYVNDHCRHLFPAGLNINFARLLEGGMIENRCFERGINRETLACGTGALAVAYIARKVYGLDAGAIDVLPHRCRWHDPEAQLRVQYSSNGWLLSSRPSLVFEGLYQPEPTLEPVQPALDYSMLHAIANLPSREEFLPFQPSRARL